jgi:hypothetical protein
MRHLSYLASGGSPHFCTIQQPNENVPPEQFGFCSFSNIPAGISPKSMPPNFLKNEQRTSPLRLFATRFFIPNFSKRAHGGYSQRPEELKNLPVGHSSFRSDGNVRRGIFLRYGFFSKKTVQFCDKHG